MGTYTHSHRSVLTCVLMCVDLCLRTLRNIGPPVLLCFTDNAFKKMDIYGNAVSGKYTGTIFPIAFAHFMSLSDFDNSCSISNHFIIIIFIILICDQWLLILLPYKCLDGQHSFNNKVFEVCTFFIYNAIVHHQTTVQYKPNFYLHRETKHSYNLVYFDIQNIFEACLYTECMSHINTYYDLPICREWPIYII